MRNDFQQEGYETLQKMVEGEKLAENTVKAYHKIEDAVVGTYQKIEDTVVGAYQKIEDKFVDAFLTRDGESVADAKQRLQAQEQGDQK